VACFDATRRTRNLFRGRQVGQRLFLLHQVLKQRLEEGLIRRRLQLRLGPFQIPDVLDDKNVFNVFCSYLGESKDPNALYLTYFNDVTITEVVVHFLQ
jgi:hypothetical protein